MAETRNKRPFTALFAGFSDHLQEWVLAKPKAYYESITYKLNNLPQTNFDLGCDFAEQGKWQDAVFRFRFALYVQPNFPKALYNLGCCYLRLNKRILAKSAFMRTLALKPDHAEALFMLSALDPAVIKPHLRPTRMPGDMVQAFFNGITAQYDATEAANHYQGGRVCYEALKALVLTRNDWRIVDLGCGTGIASRPFRALATEITGVEFAAEIARVARDVKVDDRPALDAVLEEDIADLASTAAPLAAADIILCCNVAQFIGDVQPMLQTLATRMKPGALLLLTVEPFNVAAGYGVNIDTGRFGHRPEHVAQLATALGFEMKHDARVQLYPSLPAQLFILGKA